MSSPMTALLKIGHQPHPMDEKYNRKGKDRYGAPRFALYWANRSRFVQPGLHLWVGRQHLRILPLPRKKARV